MRKGWKVAATAVLTVGFLGGTAHGTTAANPHRYVLRGVDPDPYPAVVVLRHCGNASEDSLAHLRMVRYVPGERVVYRCRSAGF